MWKNFWNEIHLLALKKKNQLEKYKWKINILLLISLGISFSFAMIYLFHPFKLVIKEEAPIIFKSDFKNIIETNWYKMKIYPEIYFSGGEQIEIFLYISIALFSLISLLHFPIILIKIFGSSVLPKYVRFKRNKKKK